MIQDTLFVGNSHDVNLRPKSFVGFFVSSSACVLVATLLQPHQLMRTTRLRPDTGLLLCYLLCLTVHSEANKAHPVQLMEPTGSNDGLRPVPSGIKWLESIQEPVHVVAVVGTFNTGKSHLLNQLIHGRGSGFKLATSINPETKGIWAWGEPVKWHGLEKKIIFLDTEGFGATGNSRSYDARIFSLAYILSSHFLHNSVRVIDQREIEMLEVLVRQAQAFGIGISPQAEDSLSQASETSGVASKRTAAVSNEVSVYGSESSIGLTCAQSRTMDTPAFTWVVEDFFQGLSSSGSDVSLLGGDGSAKQWLDSSLQNRPDEDSSSRSLTAIFSETNCHTLFLPTMEGATQLRYLDRVKAFHPDFVNDVNSLRASILQSLSSRELSSQKQLQGSQIASLITLLTRAADNGFLRSSPSRWHMFVQHYCSDVETSAGKHFENAISISESVTRPIPVARFKSLLQHELAASLDLFDKATVGVGSAARASREKLEDRLQKGLSSAMRSNDASITNLIRSQTQSHRTKLEKTLSALELPLPPPKIKAQADVIAKQHLDMSKELWTEYSTHVFMREDVERLAKLLVHELLAKNEERAEQYLTRMVRAATSCMQDKLANEGRRLPVGKNTLKQLLKTAKQSCDAAAQEALREFSDLKSVSRFRHTLDEDFKKEGKELQSQNAAALAKFLKQPLQQAEYQLMKELNKDWFWCETTIRWRAAELARGEVGGIDPELMPILESAIHEQWLESADMKTTLQSKWTAIWLILYLGVACSVCWAVVRARVRH